MDSNDLPLLPFDADQVQYDAWNIVMHQLARDPGNDLMEVDINDAIMIFAAARTLAREYPDKVDALREHTPEVMRRASTELGMFMGINHLTSLVGIDHEVGEKVMLRPWNRQP